MDRREALKSIAALTGGALSASTIAGVLGGCSASGDSTDWKPKIVTSDQNELIAAIAEMIIPETDTPGAGAAGVNEFIDLMLADWHSKDERNHFLAGLANVDAIAQSQHAKKFLACAADEQIAILQLLEKESLAPESQQTTSDGKPLKPFFAMMKELTLIGYYTSEIGMTQELKYLPSVQTFEGCVPLSEVGRAWVNV